MEQATTSTAGPARLILLRHGQASLGTDDYDRLSPLGKSQARALRARLAEAGSKDEVVVSGSLKRQRQTVAGLGRTEQASIDESLNEYTVDRLIRSTMAQAESLDIAVPQEEAFANPQAYLMTFLEWFPQVLALWQAARLECEHNGLWADFHARVTSPIQSWTELVASGKTVVVVSSAGVISTVVSELLGEELAWQRDLNVRLYNASLTQLRLDEQGRWQAERVNCVDHLDADDVTLA
ncbi:MAG: histidine phosphatase family protein [Pseudomonadota bacterium]